MSTSETITKTDLKNILEAAGNIGSVDSTPTPTASKVSEFDAAAQMNSTDMTSSEVTSFVEDLNIEGGGSGTSIPTANTAAKFDANANMNSSDMTSSVVDNFIGDLNISSAPVIERTQSDWVVETETNGSISHRRWQSGLEEADWIVDVGTEGNWAYRKWNSGIAECWGSTRFTNVPLTTQWGYGYYASNVGRSISLPSSLFTSVSSVTSGTDMHGGIGGWCYEGCSTSSVGGYLWSTASEASRIAIDVSLYVKGTWK